MEKDVFTAAAAWTAGLLTGTMATLVAVLAVATVGMLALTGRVAVRRAAEVVLGCFVLFAAPTIARGLIAGVEPAGASAIVAQAPASGYTPTVPQPAPYDPYAGASVPVPQNTRAPGIIE